MQVTLEVPETIAARFLSAGRDPARAALEALLVEGYRTQVVSEGQIRRILGYETAMQVHALLKEHDVPLDYTADDLSRDRETIRELRALETSVTA